MLSCLSLLKAGEGKQLEPVILLSVVSQVWQCLPRRDAGRASGVLGLELAVLNSTESLIA